MGDDRKAKHAMPCGSALSAISILIRLYQTANSYTVAGYSVPSRAGQPLHCSIPSKLTGNKVIGSKG